MPQFDQIRRPHLHHIIYNLQLLKTSNIFYSKPIPPWISMIYYRIELQSYKLEKHL